MNPHLRRGKRATAPAIKPPADRLPPHSPEAEKGVLGCLLLAFKPAMEACRKAGLTVASFYELPNQEIFRAMTTAYDRREPCDLITLENRLKTAKLLTQVGGLSYLMALPSAVPSAANIDYYLEILAEKSALRKALAGAARLVSGIHDLDTWEDIKALVSETAEALKGVSSSAGESPFPKVYTVRQILDYKCDPDQWLVGEDIIVRRDYSVLAGVPSAGKSMLALTLAIALARGTGTWMGLKIHRKCRTLMLQSEGSERRFQKELQGLPDKVSEHIRITEMGPFRFYDAGYRAWLRDLHDAWPYDLLVIDNWSDVVPDDKRAEHQMAFDWIRGSIPTGQTMPAVLLIAHLTKAVLKADRPMTGRTMMAHVTGSMRIMEKARTQMTLQPVSEDVNDPRVVFDFAKASNAETVPPRACYIRKPQCFEHVPDFDFEAWLNPQPADGQRGRGRGVKFEDMETVFEFGKRRVAKKIAVEALVEAGASQASAYRALSLEGPFAAHLSEEDGLLTWTSEP